MYWRYKIFGDKASLIGSRTSKCQPRGCQGQFVCAVVREGSGFLPGRHSWRTSSGGKWAQVHFLKCVLISSAWEAGNFTPGVSAQPLSLYKVKPLLVSLIFGTPCTHNTAFWFLFPLISVVSIESQNILSLKKPTRIIESRSKVNGP